MASFGVGGHDVVVEAAVFRGLVDLMLDDPGLDPDAVRLLTEERDAGALTLDLVDSPVGRQHCIVDVNREYATDDHVVLR